ncbi:MAG TPA: rod shape-determining protein RodA [Solirubrobacteraceae bacterium]
MSPLSPIQSPDAHPVASPQPLRAPLDPLLTLAVLGLAVCSILTLRAATGHLIPTQPHYYVDRQAIYLGVGLVLMFCVSRIDYALLRRLRTPIYITLMLSILAVLVLGHKTTLGAQRAINLPLFSFQASELGKVLLILALSALVVERSRALRELDTTARVMITALIPAMFVIAQPDLGSGIVYLVIAFTILFVAGTSWRHLAGLLTLVLVSAAVVLAAAPAAGIHLLKPYQVERLTAFIHPSSHPPTEPGANDPTYQYQQAKIAIGSGQKTGRGVNSSQIQLNFVPEGDTDFIFAAVGEQWGFLGAALVLSLYALLIWRTLRILTMAKDLFGSLVAGGVVAMIMFQVFVNVGMAIGIMPITGVTLPLMSYGGSSVIATLLAIGLLQSVYLQARASEALKGRVPPSPDRVGY